MKKLAILISVILLHSSLFAAATALHEKIADLQLDIGNRQVPHASSTAPVMDGVIGASEYTWSQNVVYNNMSSATVANDGSDGYGDAQITAGNATYPRTVAPSSPADCSFTVYMSHDDANLYIGVKVLDDVKCTLATAGATQFWNVDSLGIKIDADDTRVGRILTGVNQDVIGMAGGTIQVATSTEGGTGVGDIQCGINWGNSGNSYGPTFTLPDGSWGRFKGTKYAAGAADKNPNPNAATDIEYFTKFDSATTGDFTFEVRIPKTGLSYTRTDKTIPTTLAAAMPGKTPGVFTNDVIGVFVSYYDSDLADGRTETELQMENAAENLDGTDNLLNADGTVAGTLASLAGANAGWWDAANLGVLEMGNYTYECALPRFKLMTTSGVENWDAR